MADCWDGFEDREGQDADHYYLNGVAVSKEKYIAEPTWNSLKRFRAECCPTHCLLAWDSGRRGFHCRRDSCADWDNPLVARFG